MIKKLSNNMAVFMCKNNIVENDKQEICAYGIELMLASFFEVAAILLVSLILKNFIQTVIFFTVFIPLRSYAGGFHAKTHFGCFSILVVNYALFTLILKFIPINPLFFLISELIAVSVIIIFAPVDSENKPLDSKEKRIYRRKSIEIILIQALVVLAFCFFNIGKEYITSICIAQLSSTISLFAAKFASKHGRIENTDDNQN